MAAKTNRARAGDAALKPIRLLKALGRGPSGRMGKLNIPIFRTKAITVIIPLCAAFEPAELV